MRLPIDIAAHVSPALPAIIDGLINDSDIDEPVTRGVVRESVAGGPLGDVLVEIDDLIERFGADAVAEHLMRYE